MFYLPVKGVLMTHHRGMILFATVLFAARVYFCPERVFRIAIPAYI